MALQRWEMYREVILVGSKDQTDKLTLFLMQRLGLLHHQTTEARRCASRFVSEFQSKWQQCSRKKDVFERRFASWLDKEACVPQDNPSSSNVAGPSTSTRKDHIPECFVLLQSCNAFFTKAEVSKGHTLATTNEQLPGSNPLTTENENSAEHFSVAGPLKSPPQRLVSECSVVLEPCNDVLPEVSVAGPSNVSSELQFDSHTPAETDAPLLTHVFNVQVPKVDVLELCPVPVAGSRSPLRSLENIQPGPSCSTKRGRPPKQFSECSERSKLLKTENLRLHTPSEELFYATEKVLHQHGFHQAAKAVSAILEDPEGFDKNRLEPENLSPEEGLSVLIETESTKKGYLLWRSEAVKKGSNLIPSYQAVAKAKQECYPENIVVTETCAEVGLQELFNHTFKRIAKIVDAQLNEQQACDLENLELVLKYGMDGSGGHQLYKQGFSDNACEIGTDGNIFLICTVPIVLRVSGSEDKVIWKNKTPSSTRYCRPIKFIFAKETGDFIRSIYSEMEQKVAQLTKLEHYLPSRKKISVRFHPLFTMIDGKVCNLIIRSSSNACPLCRASSTNLNQIDECLQRPVNNVSVSFGISPLHAKMRTFDNLLKVAYHLDIQKWSTSSSVEAEVVRARKCIIQESFKKEMNLLVDIPIAGGNTNDGNTARRVFDSAEKSAKILGLDPTLIRRLGVVLKALSSGEEINTEMYHAYALETARLYVSLYPWAVMSPTIHKVLIHGAHIAKECLLPLGQLAEDAQESLNKVLRSYRRNNSRKCSRTATNEDIFNRLLVRSDPYISSLRSKEKRELPDDAEVNSLLRPP